MQNFCIYLFAKLDEEMKTLYRSAYFMGITEMLQINYRVLLRKELYTDKKENKIFLIYKEIQMGSGAKSYMRKGFLI